jgi:hypothetical protein
VSGTPKQTLTTPLRHHDVIRLRPLTRVKRSCGGHRQRTGSEPEPDIGRIPAAQCIHRRSRTTLGEGYVTRCGRVYYRLAHAIADAVWLSPISATRAPTT